MISTERIDAPEVLARFCRATGFSAADLCLPDNTRPVSRLRHEAMYLMRHLALHSIAGIAILMQRDKASVHAGIANVADAMAADAEYAQRIQRLAETIRQRNLVAPEVDTLKDVRRIAAIGVLADTNLTDTDARQAALILLRSGKVGGSVHG